MSNVAKLKKRAAEYELKKQFDKALAVYVELLQDFEQHTDELDVALFNRVGDILLRQGNVADAVDYYEKAVDHYAEGGFFNNAIALCNKILRQSPGRASIYYKLGKISAQKGFNKDAKQNFLEYADRMQKSGRIDEAFRALTEFADLCPDQDDIRLMLAEQLSKADRKAEAVEQFQLLYERYESEGRTAEAKAAAERMKAIDPSATPRAGGGTRRATTKDLIFLDLDEAPAPRRESTSTRPALADLPLVEPPAPPVPEPPVAPPADLEITHATDLGATEPTLDAEPLAGFESTNVEEPIGAAPGSMLDIEPTSFGSDLETAEPAADESSLIELNEPVAESIDIDAMPEPVERSSTPTHASEPAIEDLGLILPQDTGSYTPRSSGEILADLEPPLLRQESAARASPEPPAAEELPLIDFELPAPVEGGNGHADVVEPSLELVLPAEESGDDLDIDIDLDTEPPPVRRSSTMFAAQSVEILQASVEGEPENWDLRRELAEAMLDSGNREGGIHELETAMLGAERTNNLDLASRIADEIARIDPGTIKHLQKRVEYAFRTNDKPRLIEAYLALGEALGTDQVDKARAVYQRVLDLAPDDIRAQAALEALPVVEPEPEPEPAPKRRSTTVSKKMTTPQRSQPAAKAAPVPGDDSFVNLGDMLRDEAGPADTRMVVDEAEPTGDEEADFQDMLRKFKQGIAQNVEQEDYQSHYDLGIAYKEMGLVDEAIAEFQKALRSPTNRVPTYEALGQCFIEKEQYSIASTVLSRALSEEGVSDDHLVGVLYLLGRASEALNRPEDALAYYQRVFLVDIQFRDVAERISGVERAAR